MDGVKSIGGACKALGAYKIGGYLVTHSGPESPDKHGDYFTEESDLSLFEGQPENIRLPLFLEHGAGDLDNLKLGAFTSKRDSKGLYITGKIDQRLSLADTIYEACMKGVFFLSSGSAPHLVRRVRQPTGVNFLKSWPVIEGSLTFNPAGDGTAVSALKSVAALEALALKHDRLKAQFLAEQNAEAVQRSLRLEAMAQHWDRLRAQTGLQSGRSASSAQDAEYERLLRKIGVR